VFEKQELNPVASCGTGTDGKTLFGSSLKVKQGFKCCDAAADTWVKQEEDCPSDQSLLELRGSLAQLVEGTCDEDAVPPHCKAGQDGSCCDFMKDCNEDGSENPDPTVPDHCHGCCEHKACCKVATEEQGNDV